MPRALSGTARLAQKKLEKLKQMNPNTPSYRALALETKRLVDRPGVRKKLSEAGEEIPEKVEQAQPRTIKTESYKESRRRKRILASAQRRTRSKSLTSLNRAALEAAILRQKREQLGRRIQEARARGETLMVGMGEEADVEAAVEKERTYQEIRQAQIEGRKPAPTGIVYEKPLPPRREGVWPQEGRKPTLQEGMFLSSAIAWESQQALRSARKPAVKVTESGQPEIIKGLVFPEFRPARGGRRETISTEEGRTVEDFTKGSSFKEEFRASGAEAAGQTITMIKGAYAFGKSTIKSPVGFQAAIQTAAIKTGKKSWEVVQHPIQTSRKVGEKFTAVTTAAPVIGGIWATEQITQATGDPVGYTARAAGKVSYYAAEGVVLGTAIKPVKHLYQLGRAAAYTEVAGDIRLGTVKYGKQVINKPAIAEAFGGREGRVGGRMISERLRTTVPLTAESKVSQAITKREIKVSSMFGVKKYELLQVGDKGWLEYDTIFGKRTKPVRLRQKPFRIAGADSIITKSGPDIISSVPGGIVETRGVGGQKGLLIGTKPVAVSVEAQVEKKFTKELSTGFLVRKERRTASELGITAVTKTEVLPEYTATAKWQATEISPGKGIVWKDVSKRVGLTEYHPTKFVEHEVLRTPSKIKYGYEFKGFGKRSPKEPTSYMVPAYDVQHPIMSDALAMHRRFASGKTAIYIRPKMAQRRGLEFRESLIRHELTHEFDPRSYGRTISKESRSALLDIKRAGIHYGKPRKAEMIVERIKGGYKREDWYTEAKAHLAQEFPEELSKPVTKLGKEIAKERQPYQQTTEGFKVFPKGIGAEKGALVKRDPLAHGYKLKGVEEVKLEARPPATAKSKKSVYSAEGYVQLRETSRIRPSIVPGQMRVVTDPVTAIPQAFKRDVRQVSIPSGLPPNIPEFRIPKHYIPETSGRFKPLGRPSVSGVGTVETPSTVSVGTQRQVPISGSRFGDEMISTPKLSRIPRTEKVPREKIIPRLANIPKEVQLPREAQVPRQVPVQRQAQVPRHVAVTGSIATQKPTVVKTIIRTPPTWIMIPDFKVKQPSYPGFTEEKRKAKQKRAYAPTGFAGVFGIRGKPTMLGIMTGLGVRPLR